MALRGKIKKGWAQKKWAHGPLIHAHFTIKNSLIHHIRVTLSKGFSCSIDGKELVDPIFSWMDAYANRKKLLPLPLDFSPFTPFTRKGLKTIGAIPMGTVASYGEIASHIGCARGARAIGNICNKNPYPLVIPCHRVIQGTGKIGGFAYPLEIKKNLLNFEGLFIA